MILSHKSYPKLDLHGETLEVSRFLVSDFLRANYLMGNDYVRIIHGNGAVLKSEVLKMLKKSKYVESYNLNIYNGGETIVKIDRKNSKCYNHLIQSKGGN